MASIKTTYLGLELKSPLIIAASPLTSDLTSLKACEENGAGAVVLRSMFEEYIESEIATQLKNNEEYLNFSQADSFFEAETRAHLLSHYVNLLKEAKAALSIPVIASICCKSRKNWAKYADLLASNGADAIELNYYPQTDDATINGVELEKEFSEFVGFARKNIKCPVAIKMGSKYTGLANKIRSIDAAGIDGVVLFNRSYRQDIDIENLAIIDGNPMTNGSEYNNSLKWTALMAGEVKMDIAANTGIADGETVVKMLLAGAKAVEIASVVMNKGFCIIGEMNDFVSSWMDKHSYKAISDFCGILAQERCREGYLWERNEFLKIQAGVR